MNINIIATNIINEYIIYNLNCMRAESAQLLHLRSMFGRPVPWPLLLMASDADVLIESSVVCALSFERTAVSGATATKPS